MTDGSNAVEGATLQSTYAPAELATARVATPEGLSFWLDVTRGVAALLVVISHTRFHFFGLWGDDPTGLPKPLLQIFYVITGTGHEAVILFFVMSGYLVGRKHMPGTTFDAEAFRKYAIDRLVRIWIVLIPAVLLSVIVAYSAYAVLGGFYANGTDYCWPPASDILATLFFLNEGYLNTVCSNLPTWSLHSEVHYYFMWPLLIFALARTNHPRTRAIFLGLLTIPVLGLILFDDLDIKNTLVLSLAWIGGIFVHRAPVLPVPRIILLGLLLVAIVLPSLFPPLTDFWPLNDYMIAVLAILFYARVASTEPIRFAWPVAKWFAEISYSIYLTHIILISLVRTILERQFGFVFPMTHIGPFQIALFFFVLIGAIVIGFLFSTIFERHTPAIKSALNSMGRKRADSA